MEIKSQKHNLITDMGVLRVGAIVYKYHCTILTHHMLCTEVGLKRWCLSAV